MTQATNRATFNAALGRSGWGHGFSVREVGGSILDAQHHICAFFNTHDDQYRVLRPLNKDGFVARRMRTLDLIDDME